MLIYCTLVPCKFECVLGRGGGPSPRTAILVLNMSIFLTVPRTSLSKNVLLPESTCYWWILFSIGRVA